MDQIEGVDNGGQAGARLYEGRDSGHVPECRLLRQQCVWSEGGVADILRQGTG